MGILDDLKNKVEKLGDKAKEGFDDAKDKAGDLLDDVKDKAGDLLDDAKERFGDDETSPLSESSDVGPDSSSTDAVQPGYVTAEDDVTEESDQTSLEAESDLNDGPAASSDGVPPVAAELDPGDIDAQETHADEVVDAPLIADPVVEKDVDPFDQPLTETIGDELANALAAQQAEAGDPDKDGPA